MIDVHGLVLLLLSTLFGDLICLAWLDGQTDWIGGSLPSFGVADT